MWGNLRETGHVLICFRTSQNSWTITQTRNPQPCGRPTAGGAQAASWRWRRLGPSPGVLPPDRWQAVRQGPAKPGSLAASPGLGFGARRPAAALVKLETAHDFPLGPLRAGVGQPGALAPPESDHEAVEFLSEAKEGGPREFPGLRLWRWGVGPRAGECGGESERETRPGHHGRGAGARTLDRPGGDMQS